MSTAAPPAADLGRSDGAPARLVARAPASALRFFATPLPAATLPLLRALAAARGRVLERDGLAVLALGEAARIELSAGLGAAGAPRLAEELLAALGAQRAPLSGRPGDACGGPVALGSLPFDAGAPAQLVLGELTVVARAGEEPVAVALGEERRLRELAAGFPFDPAAPAPEPPRLGPAPDRFELASRGGHEAFERLVAAALVEIHRGRLHKVVCAREVTVTANRPFEQGHLVERLRALYPACAVVGLDGFVGASPELLVRRTGRDVTSQPLAGTIARSGDPDEDARLAAGLLASPKERREHSMVVDAIVAALTPLCDELTVPGEPHLLELRNVSHLATTLHARLLPEPVTTPAEGSGATPRRGPAPGALSVVAAIHPTPAVGGVPRAAALDFLVANEGLDRGRYAGPVGFVDAAGDGEFWLGIRSAMIEGTRARLIAGVGVVDGSVPRDELVETQLKLQALLAAAVRP